MLIETCSAMDSVPEKTITLFNNMLNAHHIWNARALGKISEFSVFQKHEVNNWADIHYENQRNSFEIITNADDFEKRIDYESTEGRLCVNTLQDILFHILNDATYCRGQIAVDFSNNGIDPLPLDYILYKR